MPEPAPALGALIDTAAAALGLAGLPQPRHAALRIWTGLTEAGPADAFVHRDQLVDAAVARSFQRAATRRSLGEPLAHVIGWSGFRRLTLRSDGRALIPRPESEGLVDLLLQRVRTGRVADVGTGSGCLALSLAMEGSFTETVGIDCSAEALSLARLNCNLTGARVNLVKADLCASLSRGGFDALVSNPPYLTDGEYAALDGSVRNWEPRVALISGADGMEATVRLLVEGMDVLRPGGWLALEVDCSRASLAASHARRLGWDEISVHVDLFGRERYLLARRSESR
jgi:release factor glutamine methyltransferase